MLSLLSALVLSAASTPEEATPVQPEFSDVFVSGQEGYHTFRIPAVIVSARGTVLAFCEGRRDSSSDSGDIDLVLKRSLDGGRTWGPLELVADDGPNTVGNPCPVVDRDTGAIWLSLTHNLGSDHEGTIMDGTSRQSRLVWMTHSDDDGATWAPPVDVTQTTKRDDWTWYATGPGVGIQLRTGRMVVPCDYAMAGTKVYGSNIIYSDDHGATWALGGTVEPHVNECQVVELPDGSLLLNMRSYSQEQPHRRALSHSSDGGLTWSPLAYDAALVEPICQASFLTYDPARLLFSNPAAVTRERMTVRGSEDDGVTWPHARLLHAGPAAYSCLTVLPDGLIGCLYECGDQHPYERLRFARLPIEAVCGR
jgi:sialidase-1